MNNQPNYLIPILICCVYPIAAPLAVSFAWRWFVKRDWRNITFPWRKEE